MSLGRAVLDLVGDLTPLKKDVDEAKGVVTRGMSAISSGIQSGMAKVAIGGAAVIAGAAAGMRGLKNVAMDFIDAAAASREVGAQLDAVIESTGGAAGVTSEFAKSLASGWQDVTKFEDDAIVAGEAVMLTFTRIGQQVFPDAMQSALDLATAYKMDLQSAIVMVGKALNDPIAGISSLSKVGVTLTNSQKSMIESLMKSNDLLGAQRVILGELATQTAGSAIAAGSEWAGQLTIMENKIGDWKETVGDELITLFQPALESINYDLLPAINELTVEGLRELKQELQTISGLFVAVDVGQWWREGFTALNGGKPTMLDFETIVRNVTFQVGLGAGEFPALAGNAAAAFKLMGQVAETYLNYLRDGLELQFERWTSFFDALKSGAKLVSAATRGDWVHVFEYAQDAREAWDGFLQLGDNVGDFQQTFRDTVSGYVDDMNDVFDTNQRRYDDLKEQLLIVRDGVPAGSVNPDLMEGEEGIKNWTPPLKAPAKRAGQVIADGITEGLKEGDKAASEFANRLAGYFDTARQHAKRLFDVTGGTSDPLAPGANGPFENMYRLADVAKQGGASPWAAQLGQTQEEAKRILKDFENGIYSAEVQALIDVPALQNMGKMAELADKTRKAFAAELAKGGGSEDVYAALLGGATGGSKGPGKGAAAGGLDKAVGVDMGPLADAAIGGLTKEITLRAGDFSTLGRTAFKSFGEGWIAEAAQSGMLKGTIEAITLAVLKDALE